MIAFIGVIDQQFGVHAEITEVFLPEYVISDKQGTMLLNSSENNVPDISNMDFGGPIDHKEKLLVTVRVFEEHLDGQFFQQFLRVAEKVGIIVLQ